jgi:hypothetical protein
MAADLDVSNVGVTSTYKEAVEAYDAKHGKYEDTVAKVPTDELLPLKEVPKGPDPSPFTLGPMSGGR